MAVNPPSPRAAYIHVPFCRRRCGYCNFTLVAGRDDLIPAYLDALARELASSPAPRPVDTLFLGGGTPTHLPVPHLRQLLTLVTHAFPLQPHHEFSVEANPRDITPPLVELLAEFGVNRLSLGAQSFSSRKLTLLERDHHATDVRAAVELAQTYFPVVSLDLIFGVPGETLGEWTDDLLGALALNPQHLSTYGLTIEQGARFFALAAHGHLAPLDEELERQFYELVCDRLTAAGWEHYEVSNFALPGYRCRHNETYWLGLPYYAAGPGAARFVDGRREVNHRSTTTYIRRLQSGCSPVAESESLPPEAAARERLVFALRRLEGLAARAFAQETGFSLEQLVGPLLTRYADLGLLHWDGERLRLTRAGLLVSDSLWPEFLAPQLPDRSA
ncbi:MAG: radical SAM family heme chaperone HemW [Pirellulales bacterium]